MREECGCHVACNETTYDVTSSVSMWPSDQYWVYTYSLTDIEKLFIMRIYAQIEITHELEYDTKGETETAREWIQRNYLKVSFLIFYLFIPIFH